MDFLFGFITGILLMLFFIGAGFDKYKIKLKQIKEMNSDIMTYFMYLLKTNYQSAISMRTRYSKYPEMQNDFNLLIDHNEFLGKK